MECTLVYGLFAPSDTVLRVNGGGGGGGGGGMLWKLHNNVHAPFLTSNLSMHLLHVGTNDC